VADAERALQAKATKKAAEDVRIGTIKDHGTDPVYALRGEYTRTEVRDIDVDAAQMQVRFDF
jgi:hypothetical protein